mgnify:CR=1 FL=1
MKRIIPFFLYPNFFKTIGIIISIAGLSLYLFMGRNFELLAYFGLFFIVFTKEKSESDLTDKIRSASFKTVFGYILALEFVFFLMDILYEKFEFPFSAFLLVGAPLLLYILYFNVLLMYNQDAENPDRKKRNILNLSWILFSIAMAIPFAFGLYAS